MVQSHLTLMFPQQTWKWKAVGLGNWNLTGQKILAVTLNIVWNTAVEYSAVIAIPQPLPASSLVWVAALNQLLIEIRLLFHFHQSWMQLGSSLIFTETSLWETNGRQKNEGAQDTANFINNKLSSMNLNLRDISVFALTNLIFPNAKVIDLSEVYLPGDLLILGNVTKTYSPTILWKLLQLTWSENLNFCYS